MTVILTLFSRILRCFPRRSILFLGDGIGWVWFHLIRFRREVVTSNLRLAFGESLSEPELRRLALRNFQHYGRMLLEVVQTISWGAEEWRDLPAEGFDNIKPYLEKGQGGFILTCHVGNWELAVGGAVAAGIPMDIVVKRADDPRAERWLQWYRKRTGAGIIVETGTAKQILRSITQGRFVAFMLDQFMGPPIGLPVTFFGEQAGTAAGLALLTEKRDIPVIPAYTYRDEEGRSRMVFEPAVQFSGLSEDKDHRLFQKTQRFNDVLEGIIRRHPEQWLWLHRRWKAYRGVSRWQPAAPGSIVTALLLVLSIVGTGVSLGEEQTGIPIPPDPKITMPVFKVLQDGDEGAAPVMPSVAVPKAALPAASKTEENNERQAGKSHGRRKRGRDRKKAKPQKTATLVAVPQNSTRLFDVVPPGRIPFEVGERLEVDLTWTALSAGKAVIEVRQGPVMDGRPTYWFWGNALSSKLVDAVYHVDNTIESYVDAAGLLPYKFLLHMVESKQKKETRVAFDHPQGKAFYWSQRLSQRWGNETKDRVDSTAPGARDMFSALYYARTLDYKLNEHQKFTLYENGQNMDIDLLPVGNELVTSKVGVFQCWKILVTVMINNVLRPTGDMYMWLSDDSKRYLVKFDAKIKIGSLYGNLVSIRERQISSIREKR